MNHSQIVSFIWGVADLIRDTFKRSKYQDVILPLTVLRRLDCVLAPTKRKVLAVQRPSTGARSRTSTRSFGAPPDSPSTTRRATTSRSCVPMPPTSPRTCATTSPGSASTCEVLEKFDFDNTIAKLGEAGLLFQVVQRFGDPKVNLHPAGETRDAFERKEDILRLLADFEDGEEREVVVRLVGYEINFNRYFYEYRPPRPLEEIEADIQQVEKEIVAMLREMAG